MRKNIVITGASSGIGKAIAEYLSENGDHVIGTGRKTSAQRSKFELITLDVTNEKSVLTAFDSVLRKLQTIDVLIHCAGYGFFGSLEDSSIEEAKDQFETNFFGIARLNNIFLPHFRENKRGFIIHISSMAGLIGMPFQGYYSASKFALEGYTEALRMELKPFNISICNINPGDFKTAFTSNRRVSEIVSPAYKERFNQFLKIYKTEEENGSSPIIIAKLVHQLIHKKKNISIRYVIGKKSQTMGLFMKRIVGEELFEKVMMKIWKV